MNDNPKDHIVSRNEPSSLKLDYQSYDEIKKSCKRLELLYQIGKQIFEEKDVNLVFLTILGAIKKLLPIERAFIATFEHDRLIPRAVENICLPNNEENWPISKTMISNVKKGLSILTTDAKNEEEFRNAKSIVGLNIRSVICCPLGNPENTRGLIYVDNRINKGVFTKEDLYFLTALSHYAFLSIRNSEEQYDGEIAKIRDKENQEDITAHIKIVTKSPLMLELLKKAKRISETDMPVLIVGETGTGKELLAKYIHNCSRRSDNRFVPVNIAAIQKELIHSELFGHEKGAFTNAIAKRIGRFEHARKGTIFLDEVQDMPIEMQTILLRVLEEYKFERLGNNQPIKADVRIISAVLEDPESLVEKGRLRRDLYFRLNTGILRIPPLQDRTEDIPVLLDHYLNEFNCPKTFDQEAIDVLMRYSWPGNVRELIRLAEALSVFVTNKNIRKTDLPLEILQSIERNNLPGESLKQDVQNDPVFESLPDAFTRMEKEQMQKALAMTNGKDEDAIKLLAVSRSKYYEMKKRYGFTKKDRY